jgi:hypothetical protein
MMKPSKHCSIREAGLPFKNRIIPLPYQASLVCQGRFDKELVLAR